MPDQPAQPLSFEDACIAHAVWFMRETLNLQSERDLLDKLFEEWRSMRAQLSATERFKLRMFHADVVDERAESKTAEKSRPHRGLSIYELEGGAK